MLAKDYLDMAYLYAVKSSGCKKVAVGSAIVSKGKIVSLGSNRAIPNLCKYSECLRVQKYGNDSKVHRNPEDCRAIHSEIDAICSAAKIGVPLGGSTIYVTRYPCEACAKAIAASGIAKVYYGGSSVVSDQTRDIFACYGITPVHVNDWKEDLTDR